MITTNNSGPLSAKEKNLLDAAGAIESVADANAAYMKSMTEYLAIIASAMSVADVAANLNTKRRNVYKKIRDRTVYGFRVSGCWRIPRFQFIGGQPDAPIPGISSVFACIPDDVSPFEFVRFMTVPSCDLQDASGAPQTPVAWLEAGNPVDEIIELVSSL